MPPMGDVAVIPHQFHNLDQTDIQVCLSLDFGGKFLKLSLSLMEIWPQTARVKKGRKSLMENSFKDSGVHKTFLVAIAEAMPEKYETLKCLFDLILAKEVQFTVACDLKVANLLAGVQAHGSKHPCCWCNAKKGALDQCGELHTIGRITEKAAEFQAAGRKHSYHCKKL